MFFIRLAFITWLLLASLLASANTATEKSTWSEQVVYFDTHSIGYMLPQSFTQDPRMSGAYIDPKMDMRVSLWMEMVGYSKFSYCDNGDKACAIKKLPSKIKKQVTWLEINDFDALSYTEREKDYTISSVVFFINKQPFSLSIGYRNQGDDVVKKAIVEQIIKSIEIKYTGD